MWSCVKSSFWQMVPVRAWQLSDQGAVDRDPPQGLPLPTDLLLCQVKLARQLPRKQLLQVHRREHQFKEVNSDYQDIYQGRVSTLEKTAASCQQQPPELELSLQKREELQADLEAEQEARLAVGQVAAEAVTHLTLTFQKSSLYAQICQRLFLLQTDRHPEQVLGQDRPSLLKFQLPREGP